MSVHNDAVRVTEVSSETLGSCIRPGTSYDQVLSAVLVLSASSVGAQAARASLLAVVDELQIEVPESAPSRLYVPEDVRVLTVEELVRVMRAVSGPAMVSAQQAVLTVGELFCRMGGLRYARARLRHVLRTTRATEQMLVVCREAQYQLGITRVESDDPEHAGRRAILM